MTDREIFRENLNYYLCLQGKKQKDLAEYVGAKTTTVSGWTRGISYPRADAMEKIAMFFGIPTSKLVGSNDHSELNSMTSEYVPQTYEARSLAKGMDTMPEARRKAIMEFMISMAPDIFTEGKENDDA